MRHLLLQLLHNFELGAIDAHAHVDAACPLLLESVRFEVDVHGLEGTEHTLLSLPVDQLNLPLEISPTLEIKEVVIGLGELIT